MSFRFEARDKSVANGLRRIAQEQLDAALREVASGKEFETVVHNVRRRCKRLRGLLRLVRPTFGGFDRENSAIRAAAGALSHARDAAVLIETLDKLEGRDGAEPCPQLREMLTERHRAAMHTEGKDDLLAQFRHALEAVRGRSTDWRLKKKGFDALEEGLTTTYRAFRRALKAAAADHAPELIHELRKQVKYHGFHITLLRETAPHILDPRRKLADELGNLLGAHRDLANLIAFIEREGDALPEHEREGAMAAALHRQSVLAPLAFAIGEELAAEKPKALAKRLRAYWALLAE